MSSTSSASFVVRNPYAKAASSRGTGTTKLAPSAEKRTERPWEESARSRMIESKGRDVSEGSHLKPLASPSVDLTKPSLVAMVQTLPNKNRATTNEPDVIEIDALPLQPPGMSGRVETLEKLGSDIIVVDLDSKQPAFPRTTSTPDDEVEVVGVVRSPHWTTATGAPSSPPLLERSSRDVINVDDATHEVIIQPSRSLTKHRPLFASLNDSFDDGIDWEEAGRVMDSVEATNTTSNAPTRNNTNAATLASLRPSSWMKSPPSPKAPTTQQGSSPPGADRHGTARVDLQPPAQPTSSLATMIRSLPKALQFDVSMPSMESVVRDDTTEALIRHAAVTEPLLNGWKLFPHQQDAVMASVLKRRQILALEMGLGKTLIGCCWARAFVRAHKEVMDEDLKVVVICPVSLKQEWQRTAHDMTGLTIQNGPAKSANGPTKLTSHDENASVNIQPKKKRKGPNNHTQDGPIIIASWSKVPLDCGVPDQRYVVLADEAHSMQSMAATRTKDALKLMLSPNAVGVLLLTGTPIKNGKPANLFPLLRAVHHPLGKDQKAYEIHFCEGRSMQFGRGAPVWQANGAAHIDQLRTLTQSHVLHMTKMNCLKDLPPQTRVVKDVPVSSQSQLRHIAALQDLAKIYNASKKSDQAVLGALQNLRKVDSMAKVDATVAVARVVLEREPAVVIFTSFVDVAKGVHSRLESAGWSGAVLTGQTPAQKRQGLVDNFQSGLSSVFVCTYGAGGVGLTLTAACTVILLDRPWTPGDVHQAEDRVRRIGQTKPVTSIWMSAFELDKQIDSMIASKSQTASSVLSTDTVQNNDHMSKLSINKLLQTLLPPQPLQDVRATSNTQQGVAGYSHSQGSDGTGGATTNAGFC